MPMERSPDIPGNNLSIGNIELSLHQTDKISPSISDKHDSSTSSMSDNLKEILEQKEKWVIAWNLLCLQLLLPNDIIYLLFYGQFKLAPKLIIVFEAILSIPLSISLVYFIRHRRKENKWMLWIPMCISDFKLFSLLLLFQMDKSFYLNENATSLADLVTVFKMAYGFVMMGYFYHKFIMLEQIKSKKQRLIYTYVLGI